MWFDLILLNLMAIFGSAGVTLLICVSTGSAWGFLVMGVAIIAANWNWWSVYFNGFKWFP